MSELEIIQSALGRAARRRRWARAMRGLWQGLFAGAVLSLLLIGAYKLLPLPPWTVIVAVLLPVPCLLVGFIIGGWRKLSVQEIARWVDGRQHLQERLSTALEVGTDPGMGRWGELVVSDAAEHAKTLDPKRLLAFQLPRSTHWALVCLALVAGLGFVPEYRTKNYIQKKADEKNIKEAGRHLIELTRYNLAKRPPAAEPVQRSIESVAALGDTLSKKTLTRSDALKDLANVAEQLRDQLKQLGKDPVLRKMEQAARTPSGSDPEPGASLQKQIAALQKQLGSPVNTPENMDKVKKQLEKLQEAAKGLSDKNSGATEAERQKLSASLSSLSRQMQDMGMNLPQINDAIQALAANQSDLFLKNLQTATRDLEKMRDMAQSLQQLQQQAEKLGKDLAEQLKNGQPELAQQTLQKMIDQLKAAQLSPEQMNKMMNEVSKAVNPAGKYGKVAEHLKNATQQMKGGNQQSAAQSLAKASDELNNLMQQLGDADELQSEIDALNQASDSVCQGSSLGPPRMRKGGHPGSGVGTWADDDDSGWDGQSTAGWDNSGVQRPDQAPRGQSDRGGGELSDALQPTKVRGQFSPGGPMPSITLKGVSIKGTSKVDYEAAAAAAQSDAQSALSHEKVPRAYQGAVRDYFDDLK